MTQGVAGSTLVESSEGLCRIESYLNDSLRFYFDPSEYNEELGAAVSGRMNSICTSDSETIFKLDTLEGYSIEATADFPILTKNGMKLLANINIGDKIVTTSSKGNFGYYSNAIQARIFANEYLLIDELILAGKGVVPYQTQSMRQWQGYFDDIYKGKIIENVLCGRYPAQSSFLVTLFKGGNSFITTNRRFACEAQIILSNFGIFSKITEHIIPHESRPGIYSVGINKKDRPKLRLENSKAIDTPSRYLAEVNSIELVGSGKVYDSEERTPKICNGIRTG